MGRRLWMALAVIGAFMALGIAVAAGSTRSWSGSFTGGSPLTFKIHVGRNSGPRPVVRHFSFTSFPLSCDRGANTITSTLPDRFVNRHHEFHAHLRSTASGTNSRLDLFARIHHRHRVTGNMRIFGSAVPVDHGSPDHCDSGIVRFRARRT